MSDLNLHIGETLRDSSAALKHLDRRDWWRWATVGVISLLLTSGVFVLSMPTLQRDIAEQREIDIGVTGLFALVLLFDIYAFYQQLVIGRLRRELSKHIGMMATLEFLKEPEAAAGIEHNHVRRHRRFYLDQRVSVVTVLGERPVVISGRTSDISEGGVGAVLPESLPPSSEVTLQVMFDDGKLMTPAVVRQRRGFHHGIEFLQLKPDQAERIRAACLKAKPVPDFLDSVAR